MNRGAWQAIVLRGRNESDTTEQLQQNTHAILCYCLLAFHQAAEGQGRDEAGTRVWQLQERGSPPYFQSGGWLLIRSSFCLAVSGEVLLPTLPFIIFVLESFLGIAHWIRESVASHRPASYDLLEDKCLGNTRKKAIKTMFSGIMLRKLQRAFICDRQMDNEFILHSCVSLVPACQVWEPWMLHLRQFWSGGLFRKRPKCHFSFVPLAFPILLILKSSYSQTDRCSLPVLYLASFNKGQILRMRSCRKKRASLSNIKILSQLLIEIRNSPFHHRNTCTCSIFAPNKDCVSLFWVVQGPGQEQCCLLVSALSSYWASQLWAQSYDWVDNWVRPVSSPF